MSELYQLPNGWEWKTLSDVFTIERGGSPRPIKDYITEDEDGINWIKIGDTEKGGKYITSTEQKIKPSGLKKSRLVVDGDFIMSNSMSFGRPYIVKTKGAIHDGWLLMREKLENMDKDYFYYLLSSNYMYQQFTSKASGTTVKNLNIDLVKSTNVPIPPLSEQQRIVSKLDLLFEKIDKSISLHQKNMDETDVFIGSVLNDVFGELEEKRLITEKQLNECFIVKDGTHDSPKYVEDGFPLFTSKNLKDYGLDTTNFKCIKEEDYVNINKRSKVDKGDILFAMIGTIGNPTLVDFEPNFAIKNVALFKPLDEKSNMEYLRYYFLSNYVIDKMKSEANGATQKFVGLTYLREFPFKQPSVSIQQKVVKYFDEISEKIEKVKSVQKEKMDSLKALKASILDKAFRGEL